MIHIISKQPRCSICNKHLLEWNPYADIHYHVECMSEQISDKLITIIKKQLNYDIRIQRTSV